MRTAFPSSDYYGGSATGHVSSVKIYSAVCNIAELSVQTPFVELLFDLLLGPASLVPLMTLDRFHLNSTLHVHPPAICCSPKLRCLIGLAQRIQCEHFAYQIFD